MLMNTLTNNHLAGKGAPASSARLPCRRQVAALPVAQDGDRPASRAHGPDRPGRDTGRWALPKGWPAGTEERCDAAAREAGEDAGTVGIDREARGRTPLPRQGALFRLRKSRPRSWSIRLEVDTAAEKWEERRQRKRKRVAAADVRRAC